MCPLLQPDVRITAIRLRKDVFTFTFTLYEKLTCIIHLTLHLQGLSRFNFSFLSKVIKSNLIDIGQRGLDIKRRDFSSMGSSVTSVQKLSVFDVFQLYF